MPATSHRLFFYGSLRKGEYNHRKTLTDLFVTDGHIRGAQLIGGNAYPWIIPSEDASDLVIGEVYDIPADMFKGIEMMEVGAGYIRTPVKVFTDEAEKITYEAEAYFYADPEGLDGYPRIPSGDWTKRDKT